MADIDLAAVQQRAEEWVGPGDFHVHREHAVNEEHLALDILDLVAEVRRLRALINTPRTDDFLAAVQLEAAHQINRWGAEHDAGKRAEDWVALVVYLLGKATKAHYEADRDKLLHHVITLAAVALNWHRNLTGASTAMRPGVAPRARCSDRACGWEGDPRDCVGTETIPCCPACGRPIAATEDRTR